MFYTISDSRFFLGTVALINSLHRFGYNQPVTILDCGLTEEQQQYLKSHTLVSFDRAQARNPLLFKPFASLLDPKGIVIIIDSDLVLTDTLDEVLQACQDGKICAFPDPLSTRWFIEWQQIFALPKPLRRQIYLNTGFVAFSVEAWPNLLQDWWQACERIWSHPTLYEGASHHNAPTSTGDQDAFNAVLMSKVPPEAVHILPLEKAPASSHFKDVIMVDAEHCQYRGYWTLLVHGSGRHKPWDKYAWVLVRKNPYVRLLRGLLTDLNVPMWLRDERLLYVRVLDFLNWLIWTIVSIPFVFPLAQKVVRKIAGRT